MASTVEVVIAAGSVLGGAVVLTVVTLPEVEQAATITSAAIAWAVRCHFLATITDMTQVMARWFNKTDRTQLPFGL